MIELIHCHIPKTGGVSFLDIINKVYGKEAIAFPWTWLGMAPEGGKGFNMLWYEWPKLKRLWNLNIPRIAASQPELRVLQGHHPVGLFNGIFPKAKRIAWVRHPIARVVSHYHHDMAKGHQSRMPLERYVKLDHNRNIMAFHLGHNIDNMDWIGVLERIDRDIIELAELLDWPTIPDIPHLNKSKRPTSFEGLGQMIADLNTQDMEIYAQVVSRKPEEEWML
jgi:hypothetical protein